MAPLPLPFLDCREHAGHDEKGDQGDGHAANRRNGHRLHDVRPTAGRPENRHQANDGSRDGHQTRPYALEPRLQNSLADFLHCSEGPLLEHAFQVGGHDHAVVIDYTEKHIAGTVSAALEALSYLIDSGHSFKEAKRILRQTPSWPLTLVQKELVDQFITRKGHSSVAGKIEEPNPGGLSRFFDRWEKLSRWV
jgi:hypothetical protein